MNNKERNTHTHTYEQVEARNALLKEKKTTTTEKKKYKKNK